MNDNKTKFTQLNSESSKSIDERINENTPETTSPGTRRSSRKGTGGSDRFSHLRREDSYEINAFNESKKNE